VFTQTTQPRSTQRMRMRSELKPKPRHMADGSVMAAVLGSMKKPLSYTNAHAHSGVKYNPGCYARTTGACYAACAYETGFLVMCDVYIYRR
jgi:hypothetical protein